MICVNETVFEAKWSPFCLLVSMLVQFATAVCFYVFPSIFFVTVFVHEWIDERKVSAV